MRNFVLLIALLIGGFLHAQDIINADRPDQSEGVYVLPQNRLQIEAGLTSINKSMLTNAALRYGLGNNTEIRLSTDAQSTKNIAIDAVVISAKHRLYTSNNGLPSITAVGYITYTPNVQKKWSTDLTMAFEHTLSEQWSLDWNIGINQQFKGLIYTTELNYSPKESLNIFAEYFINFGNIRANHNIDLGVMYAITPNFQVDIAVGQTLFSTEKNRFGVLGFSYRFKEL